MKKIISVVTTAVFAFNFSFANQLKNNSQKSYISPISNSLENKQVTVDEFKTLHPNSTIKEVTPEELKLIAAAYEQQNNTASNEPSGSSGSKNNRPCVSASMPQEEQIKLSDTSLNHSKAGAKVDLDLNSFHPSGGGSNKDTLIFIAVIGVIVVAFLVIYAADYLITAARNGFDCSADDEFGFRFHSVSDSTKTQVRSGRMNSIYYTMNYFIPSGKMGLTGEFGNHLINLHLNANGLEKEYYGNYFLLGPNFSFPLSYGTSFLIELLAGTSTANEIGLMSTLRLGFDFQLTPTFNLGLNVGAALINIKNFDNYINSEDQINLISGGAISFKW